MILRCCWAFFLACLLAVTTDKGTPGYTYSETGLRNSYYEGPATGEKVSFLHALRGDGLAIPVEAYALIFGRKGGARMHTYNTTPDYTYL